MKKLLTFAISLLLVITLLFSGCQAPDNNGNQSNGGDVSGGGNDSGDGNSGDNNSGDSTDDGEIFDLSSIPAYSGTPYVNLNGGVPEFKANEITTESYEFFSNLDSLGRCGYVMACIGLDLMPTEDRGSIGQVKPSGWHTVKYDCVDGKYLYNRCHLIGFQLTGENANTKNLITGTRYFNVDGMLPFEDMVADYVKETENHVMYRVTPIFSGSNLVANGVVIEAYSVEDSGEGISFNVYIYNVQPGIVIDYKTGLSYESGETPPTEDGTNTDQTEEEVKTYILNTNTKKFHKESCGSAKDIKESNKQVFTGTKSDLESDGFSPCGICKP